MVDKKETMHIPQYEIEALARCLLPDIIKYFQSKKGQQEFEKWKQEKYRNTKVL